MGRHNARKRHTAQRQRNETHQFYTIEPEEAESPLPVSHAESDERRRGAVRYD